MNIINGRRSLQRAIFNGPPRASDGNLAEIANSLASGFENFKAQQAGDLAKVKAAVDDMGKKWARLLSGGGGGAPAADSVDAREIAGFYAAARGRELTFDEVPENTEELREYAAAFGSFLRHGDNKMTPDIRAAMTVGSGPDGGYWAPPEISTDIKRRLFDSSPIRQVASVLGIMSDSIKFPVDANDATSGGWVGETEERSDTDTSQVGEQEIFVREQYAQPKVSQKLLVMAGFDIETWLINKIVDKLARTENSAFVSGSGVKAPKGFLTYKDAAVTTDDAARAWGKLQYVPSGSAGGFPKVSGSSADDPAALIDLQAKLKPEFRQNAVWMMNRAASAIVRKLRDADGRFLWTDALVSGQPPILLGSPVVTAEDMPAVASDSFSIAYGDFGAGYQIVDGPAISVLRDPFTQKGYVRFYTTKWTGGDVVNFDALKLLKFGAS